MILLFVYIKYMICSQYRYLKIFLFKYIWALDKLMIDFLGAFDRINNSVIEKHYVYCNT